MPQGQVRDLDPGELQAENERLRRRVVELQDELTEAVATLEAIRSGDVDAVVVERGDSADVFTLAAADRFYFQLAQKSANIGTWDWDLVKNRASWSEGIYQLLGIDPAQAGDVAAHWRNALHPDDRPRVEPRVAQFIKSEEKSYDDEFRIVRPDGATVWVASKGQLLRNPAGEPVRFIGVSYDITDRKRVEEALAESELLFRQMADSMPQMAWMARPDGYVDYFNRRWYEFTGFDASVGGDDSFTPIIHQDDVRRCLDQWYAAVRSGLPYNIEYRFWSREDSDYRWFLGRALPLHGGDGEIKRWFGTSTDIHDIKVAQEKLARSEELLRDADRRKDEFLAMLAHELRNPLAPLQTGLDLLSLEREADDETLPIMRDQVGHMVRLVDDLLDVSRIMRGRVELQREPLELSTLATRVAAAVRSQVDGKRQKLVIEIADDSLWCDADPVRMAQVLTNLLNNASKYSEAGTTIRCRIARDGASAVVEVRDEGIGIDPEFLPRVFELLAQAARSSDRAQGGLGIGLTLVKNLVELHGGSVAVASDGLGKGSCFTVRLPLAVEIAQQGSSPAGPPAVVARRILVVDDNISGTTLVSRLLMKLGSHEVRTAQDAATALQLAAAFSPEIVLLDIGLPGMDGYDLARALRDLPATRNALLVAVTGYGQADDRRRTTDAGIDVHLVKPTSQAQLKELLNHAKLSPR